MSDYHTKSEVGNAAGYGVQISGFYEHGKIGKYKPDVSFKMRGPYEAGFSKRCLARIRETFVLMSVPEVKALWIYIGMSLGVAPRSLEKVLHEVPYDKRAID